VVYSFAERSVSRKNQRSDFCELVDPFFAERSEARKNQRSDFCATRGKAIPPRFSCAPISECRRLRSRRMVEITRLPNALTQSHSKD
jgi:hypothetical protein